MQLDVDDAELARAVNSKRPDDAVNQLVPIQLKDEPFATRGIDNCVAARGQCFAIDLSDGRRAIDLRLADDQQVTAIFRGDAWPVEGAGDEPLPLADETAGVCPGRTDL